MKKKRISEFLQRLSVGRKISLAMRLTVISTVLFSVNVFAGALSQTVSLKLENVTLREAFKAVKQQTGVYFVFNEEEVARDVKLNVDLKDASLKYAMKQILRGLPYSFECLEGMVVIKPLAAVPQEKKIKILRGVVTDSRGEPLPGVTVMMEGAAQGCATDVEGKYILVIGNKERVKIIYSFVGMNSEVRVWEGQEKIDVRMHEATMNMNEVVVTGYQNMRKGDVVGSVATLKAEDIMMPAYSSIDQMLQGRVAGMVVMNTSSRVGTSPKIRIRGTSTILGNQDPLWVVDGVIQPDPLTIDQSSLMVDDLKTILGNQISWLNPADIQTVTVLKDASATAIYGSKAANGVIVITTKKGVSDRLTVNYSGNFSFRARPNYEQFNLMNSHERIQFSREAFAAGATYNAAPVPSMDTYEGVMALYMAREISQIEAENGIHKLETANTDWMKLLLSNSFSHHHNLSFSGGTQKVFYNASLSYNDDKGIEQGNKAQSMSGRLRIGAELHPKVYVDLTMIGSMNKNKGYAAGVDPMEYAKSTSRSVRAFDDDGELIYLKQQERYRLNQNPIELGYNILNEIENSYSLVKATRLNTTFNFRWDILSWLKYEFVGSVNRSVSQSESYAGEKTNYIARNYRGYDFGTKAAGSAEFKAAILPFGGELYLNEAEVTSWNVQNKLNFEKTFVEDHRINVMLGMEAISTENRGRATTNWGYSPDRGEKLMQPTPIHELVPVGGGDVRYILDPLGIFQGLYSGTASNRTTSTNNSFSLFATAAYSYKNRYVLNASIRNDESNRFGQDQNKRFDPTYSFGISWRMTEEAWMARVKPYLSQVNFRASYGLQGNAVNSIGPDLIATQGGVNSYYNEYYVNIFRLPNPNLSWERTKSYNLGLDLQLLDWITFTAEYYHKKANNIVTQDIAWEYGIGSMAINGGTLTNAGMEYSLNITPIRTKDWGWTIGINSSKNWNKAGKRSVDNLDMYDFLDGRSDRVLKEGYDLSSFWSYSFAGLDPERGFPMFNKLQDADGNVAEFNGEYTDYLVYSGRMEPNFTGGLTTRLRWKGLTLGANFSLLLGARRRLPNPYPLLGANQSSLPNSATNLDRKLLARWKKAGDELFTDIPAVFNGLASEQMISLPWDQRASMYYMWGKSDALVVNGSFLRCQQIMLTWNVKDEWCRNIGLKSLIFSASVSNPFVICSKKFDGFDPELGNSVQPKIYSFGINIGI